MITDLAQILINLETLLADIDGIYLNLHSLREQGFLMHRKLDRLILNSYELLDTALTSLYDAYQINKEKIHIQQVSHKHFRSNLPLRRLLAITRKLSMTITQMKQELIKLRKKIDALKKTEALKYIDKNELIIESFILDQLYVIITINKLIILDKQKGSIKKIPLHEIRDIVYKKTLMFKGCEIKLANSEKVKLQIDADLTIRLRKRIIKIRQNKTKLQNLSLKIASKRNLLRPDIDNAKIILLKNLINQRSPNSSALL